MKDFFDKKKLKSIFILTASFLFLIVNISFSAQGQPSNAQTSQLDITCQKFNYPWCGATDLGGSSGVVNKIYTYSLAAVGVVALGVIVYGGIKYTVSAGNSSAQSDAIAWIRGAIYGIVLLFGASLLFREINPEITNLAIEKPPAIETIKATNITSHATLDKTTAEMEGKACAANANNCGLYQCISGICQKPVGLITNEGDPCSGPTCGSYLICQGYQQGISAGHCVRPPEAHPISQ